MKIDKHENQRNENITTSGLKMLIVFAHGKESGPWGRKITQLANIGRKYGADVISPDYSDLPSPDLRVKRLLALELPGHDRLILAGSSMGGYVSIVASRELNPSGLFLMAPAIGLPRYDELAPTTNTQQLCIVHGWSDSVVPVENVFDFARQHKADLHILDAEHDLRSCLEQLEDIFIAFLEAQIKN